MIWQRWRRRWRECDHSRIIIIVRRIEPVVYEICTGLRVAATRNDCVRIERSLGNAVPMHPGNQQQMLPRVYVFSPIVVFDFHTGFMASFLFLRFSLSPSLSLSLSLSVCRVKLQTLLEFSCMRFCRWFTVLRYRPSNACNLFHRFEFVFV